jgi:hypothetical protein
MLTVNEFIGGLQNPPHTISELTETRASKEKKKKIFFWGDAGVNYVFRRLGRYKPPRHEYLFFLVNNGI